MKYHVDWTSDAEADPARIWADSSDRRAVAEAANQFDVALQHDPKAIGESRDENVRIRILFATGD